VTEGTELHLSSRSHHKGMPYLSLLVHNKGKPLDHERKTTNPCPSHTPFLLYSSLGHFRVLAQSWSLSKALHEENTAFQLTGGRKGDRS